MNTNALNTTGMNGLTGIASVPPPAPVFAVRDRAGYTLEYRDRDGGLIGYLPDYYGAGIESSVNGASVLRFSYSGERLAGSPIGGPLAFPREVWVYRNDSGDLVDKFTVISATKDFGVGRWHTYECESFLGQLSRESVELIEADEEDGLSVSGIIDLLFGAQTQSPAITVGGIDASIANTVLFASYQNRSVRSCLSDIEQVVGGYYWVSPDREFFWREERAPHAGTIFALDRNAVSIAVTTDYRSINTRVHGLGLGTDPELRDRATRTDTAAAAEYGTITGFYNRQNIPSQSLLEQATEAELDRRARPRATYRIGAINIGATSIGFDFDADTLHPGAGIVLNTPDGNISTRIVKLNQSLDAPTDITVHLADPEIDNDITGTIDPRRAQDGDLLDAIAQVFDDVEMLKSDRGEVETVRRAISPDMPDMDRVLWYDIEADEGQGEDPGPLQDAIEDILDYPADDIIHWDTGEDLGNMVDAINDAIAKGLIDVSDFDISNEDPLPVGIVQAPGTSELAARADHEHPWQGEGLPEEVSALPAIPSTGFKMVKLTTGSADAQQIWIAYTGDARWYPIQKPTTHDGEAT